MRNIAYQSTSEEESAAIIKYLKADSEKIQFSDEYPFNSGKAIYT